MITFLQPIWLLLLLPAGVALWLWPLPGRWQRLLRGVTLVLIVLALARLAVRLPDRSGVVIVVADRSASMPAQAAAAQEEIIRLLERSRRPRDEVGVVSFGQRAVVESVPQRGAFPGFRAEVGRDQSSLAEALETALTLIPDGAGGRILVLSDGKWTGRDPMGAATRAAARGVAIDYRLLSRPEAGDVGIQSFDVPQSAAPSEGFLMTAWVWSPGDQEIRYRLLRNGRVLASGSRRVETGLTRLMFRDLAPDHGLLEYELEVEGAAEDPVPENNRARALLMVRGEPALLVASEAGESSGLVRLLRAGGLRVVAQRPGAVRWTADALMAYDAVLLEQVPASVIGSVGLENLALWVEGTGRGLMLTGGPKGFGAGGYFRSPLERVLPLTLESPREHLKQSVAIVVALDRSGSMAAPVGGGRTKMDLANLGTVQVLDLLGPGDEIGVIAVDSSPHVIVELDRVERNAARRGRILSIQSMGGGIFIYEALSAAARMILESRAQRRHIILFADAADSEEPGAYRALLEKCREAGVTVSVIGLGTEADQDAWLLKEIAQLGGGECYFTASAEEIPRLFAQDTFTVARLAFVEGVTPFRFTPAQRVLGLGFEGEPPPVGGYNLCFLRPGAQQAAVTTDENAAPVVAFWNAGLGRVLTFSGEADGQFAGPLASWDRVGEFYTTLARWTMGRQEESNPDLLLRQEIRDGACYVQVHLDPQRREESLGGTPRLTSLTVRAGLPPRRETVPLEWRSADLLEAVVPLESTETRVHVLEIPGRPPLTLPPVCLPYSPELAPGLQSRGSTTLAELAAATGGRERGEIPRIWSELPVRRRWLELTPWLFLAAMVLFLAEVWERYTGWLSARLARRTDREMQTAMPGETAEVTPTAWSVPTRRRWSALWGAWRRRSGQPAVQTAPTAPAPGRPRQTDVAKPAGAPGRTGSSTYDALREARERARRRRGL